MVVDIGHSTLSLSRQRCCDKTDEKASDIATKRARVRQDFNLARFIARLVALTHFCPFCRTVMGEIATVGNVR